MKIDNQSDANSITASAGKHYQTPELEFFGLVSDLTLGGPGSCPDGGESDNNNVNGNFGGQC